MKKQKFSPKKLKKARKLVKVPARRDPIWDLPELAKMPNKPMGASEEDKIIYGIR